MRDFDSWVASLELGVADDGGDIGQAPAGHGAFLREVFDAEGDVGRQTLAALWHERETILVTRAVALFAADLHRTTDLTPKLEVVTLEDGVVAATYDGSYTTPVISSIREPESICDVVDNLRDQVVDDLWTVWPVCPRDRLGLDPKVMDGRAVRHCRVGKHVVSEVGDLQPPT